ncbi:MAG TPA: glycosyltransferase family 2 protein [Polyangiaceae bacterium]
MAVREPARAPKVSIIVIFGGGGDMRELLPSLLELDYPNFEVVLVDNQLLAGARAIYDEFVAAHPGFPARFLEAGGNLGFSGGNNVGIRRVVAEGTDYVLLLNDDTLVAPDFLRLLVDALEGDRRAGIAGPKIYFAEHESDGSWSKGRRIWFGGGAVNWLRTKPVHVRLDELDDGAVETSGETEFMTGCALLIRREVIDRIGPMPEEYFLYCEDLDWCLAARAEKWKILYVPASHVWHKVSRSTGGGSPSYVYYNVRNRLMVARKYADPLRALALHAHALAMLSKQPPKFFMPSRRKWAGACLRAIVHFYVGRAGKLA